MADPTGAAARPPSRTLALVVGAATSAERRLVDEWAASHEIAGVVESDRLAEQLRRDAAGGDESVSRWADDTLLLPVKVAWLPSVQRSERPSRLADLWLMATPKRPATWLARRLAARTPGRRRVIAGDPATLGDLRARHARVVGSEDAGDPDRLARFIRRAAVVALERTERSLIGDRYKVPHAVAEEIMARAAFRERLRTIAHHEGIGEQKAFDRAEDALDELVSIQTRAGVDTFYATMAPLHSRTWDVVADESGLARLRELNRRSALVFLPSHRSYVDTMVLGDVLARNDFPRNHVMGGANLRIWPISDMGRRAGVVFIRRSFGKDEIYKAVVAEYFAFLLAKRFNLEWYFEGGRSRTGKLRPPRYGLLRYVVDAVASGRVEDVYLVPTSITYDRLHEVASMAAEQAGATKKPEGLAWLAGYARSQRRTPGGKAYVRFGEPISVRSRVGRSTGSQPDAGAGRTSLHKLAFEVAVGINATTPVTANALMSLTLLGVRDQSLTLDQIRQVLAPILDYIDARAIPTTGLDVLRTPEGVRSVLAFLERAKVVTVYDRGSEPVYAVGRDQHLVAAFYRNNAIHWFLNRAILELALLWTADHGRDHHLLLTGWPEAKRIRDQLKFEFFFPDRDAYFEQLRQELELLAASIDVDVPSRERIDEGLRASGVLMAHRVLRTFLDAQLVVLDRLASWPPGEPVDRDRFLAECDSVGRQLVLQRRLHGMEAVSQELFSSAMELADNLGLLQPDGDDLAGRRAEALAYVGDLIDRVRRIERIDASNRAEVTGVAVD